MSEINKQNQPHQDSSEKMPEAAIEAMLEEYKQMYEGSRQNLERASTRGDILITISFAILGYTIGGNIDTSDLFIAAFVSIFIYFVALFDKERAIRYGITMYDRIREIENDVNEVFSANVMSYQSTVRERMNSKTNLTDRKLFAWFVSPASSIAFLVRFCGIREVRSYGIYVLTVLWAFRIY